MPRRWEAATFDDAWTVPDPGLLISADTQSRAERTLSIWRVVTRFNIVGKDPSNYSEGIFQNKKKNHSVLEKSLHK